MSFSNADAFKNSLNKMGQGCRCGCKSNATCNPTGPTYSGIVGSNGPCGPCGDAKCDSECKGCDGDNESQKPNSERIQDDGCFCRECNTFLPMVEPDDVGDGKTKCYMCANPW